MSGAPLIATLEPVWKGVGDYDERYRCAVESLGIAAVSKVAVFDLCRRLVAAGVPDQPLDVRGPDGKPRLRITSIHDGAKLTVVENASEGPRIGRYRPFPERSPFAAVPVTPKEGSEEASARWVGDRISDPTFNRPVEAETDDLEVTS